MAHLWQQDHGKPSRANYHNKEWARKMEEIGLIPSSTGKEGGKKTGQKMTHYIMSNGPFTKAFNDLSKKSIDYISSPLLKTEGKKRTASKIKYSCQCGNNVWGKPSLMIICVGCNTIFLEENEGA
jgi:predicted SprT family Zn-dependent metalloprotease